MSCIFPGCSKPTFPGSQYCSRYHRDNAPSSNGTSQAISHAPSSNRTSQPISRAPSSNGITCAHSGCSKPVFPGGKYCSRSHRDTNTGPSSQNTSTSPSVQNTNTSPSLQSTKTVSRSAQNTKTSTAQNKGTCCQYSGCVKSVYPESKYCSRKHRDAATAPGLVELSAVEPKHQDVSTQFKQKWLHARHKPVPPIYKIYQVTMPKSVQDQYDSYKRQIGISRTLPEGNQQRRFHGTTRACCLGENGLTLLCQSKDCSLCSILRDSFKLTFAGTQTPWKNGSKGRFGAGIYTSATSSKSDDYSKNRGLAGAFGHKAMLLNKVVVGSTIKLTKSNSDLRAPPGDHDSVIGEPGGSLNYDELIVYDDRAIIPAYLILYG